MLPTLLTTSWLVFANPGDGLVGTPRAVPTLRDARSCAVIEHGVVVGTASGVSSFDAKGRHTQTITELDGLPGARVDALLRDGDSIWVGSEAGIARLESSDDRLSIEWSRRGPSVRSLAAAGDGGLWVGTWGEGLEHLDAKSLTSVPFADGAVEPSRRGPARRITDLQVHDDTLWVGTAAGLFRLDGRGEQGPRLRPVDGVNRGIGVQTITRSGRELYVGDLAGLRRVDGAIQLSTHDVRDTAFVDGRLWLATYDAGLVPTTGTRDVEAPTGRLLDVDVAADGRACAVGPDAVWVRESKDGWRRLSPGGLPSGDVSALLRDGERLWVGTFDRGLAVQAGPDQRFVDVPLVDREVNALARIPGRAGVFVGTADGLFHVRPVRGGSGYAVDRFDVKSGLPSMRVQALLAADDGSLVIGTARGIVRLRHGRIQAIRGARTWSVFALAAGESGVLFIGTTRGLVRLDARGRKLYYSVLGGHLPDDWITALAYTAPPGERSAALFVGTYAGGVTRLTPANDGPGSGWAGAARRDLGGGRINIGALYVRGEYLWAGTMDELHVWPLGGEVPLVARPGATLGRDVTAVVFQGSSPLAVAGRRGIVARDFFSESREP